ncbi:retrovirus-related pol polyprotein from transposon 17.6 [Plakobranchus ocellatus]|uniref:Retrovirus-related pol polyprotein from transposon 17.6 n=1 Tax=Plakobranchus ocellatus TaxID=259542 RepID=A0AAV4DA62_9GAST|nr:retrovirus-related pol polyprotein from transposon 17.6 [Plakobranchus ocellatus]
MILNIRIGKQTTNLPSSNVIVLVFSASWEEHLVHVGKTLETLQRAKFTIKHFKNTVGNTTVEFLGHQVSGGEIKPDNTKTQKDTGPIELLQQISFQLQ